MRVRFLVTVALSLHALASPARAQSDEDKARTLFREARQLAAERQYEKACPRFEQSLAIERGIGTMYNLADCWEKLGRLASAHALFVATAESARSMGQSDRAGLARERAVALEPKLSRLLLTVGTPAKGLALYRGEKPIDEASWGIATPIDAGSHEIKATAPGKQPFVATIEIPERPTTITVTVPPLADAAQRGSPRRIAAPPPPPELAPAPPPDSTPARDTSSGNSRIVALAVGGAGVGALVAGVVLALDYRAKNDEATAICPSAVNCSRAEIDRHASLVDDARTARNWSYLAFGVGGAAVLGGATIYLTSKDDGAAHGARLGVSPLTTATGPAGAVVRGSW